MALTYTDPVNPYAGLASSIVTSNVVDLRDAYTATFSFATIGTSFSTTTISLSNGSGSGLVGDGPAVGGFSAWTVLGNAAIVSGITIAAFPAGYRFALFQRSTSSASISINKSVWI